MKIAVHFTKMKLKSHEQSALPTIMNAARQSPPMWSRGHHCPMLFQYISVFIWHAGKITWKKVFWNFWSPWFLSITGFIWCFSDYGMVQLSITVFIFDTQHHIRSNTHLTVHLVDFCVCYLHIAATMIAKIFCIYKFLPTSSPCFGFNHP